MIYLYISPSCQSCRKAIKWFQENKIEYKVIDIIKGELTKEDIFRILKNTENGFEDIISTRSIPYSLIKDKIEDMKTSELVDYILENPTILKRPIIVSPEIINVGYNADEIRAFIPQERRNYNPYCETCEDTDPLTCEHKDELVMLISEIKEALLKEKNETSSSN